MDIAKNELITRDILLDDFVLVDHAGGVFNRAQLSDRIDHWKSYLLNDIGVTKGQRVGFALLKMNIEYVALFFACCELGLIIVILDWSMQLTDNSLRVAGVSPIHIFLADTKDLGTGKRYVHHAERVIDISGVDLDRIVPVRVPYEISPEDPVVLTTSSGTSGTPKPVYHNHGFIAALARRNTFLFNKDEPVIHIRNLHHGSSLATFFLPALAGVAEHHVMTVPLGQDGTRNLARYVSRHDIAAIQFPYPTNIDDFLKTSFQEKIRFRNLRIFTLTYVLEEWQPMLVTLGIGEITGIFGATESSGPVFLSRMNPETQFNPRFFSHPDDFYDIIFEKGTISVKHKELNFKFPDKFEKDENGFIHNGRNDIIRINDVLITINQLKAIIRESDVDGELICDSLHQKIYLALWREPVSVDLTTKHVEARMRIDYPELRISKSDVLDKSAFIGGIKVDAELIREHFRKM
jgi:hypothetical protein